jgi:hypothetical protein
VNELANACFTDWIRERMSETQIAAATLSLDSVLSYWASEAKRQSIDGEQITAFLKASVTLATLPEATRTIWLNKLPKIAAPSYRGLFNQQQAGAIIAKLAEADLEHPVCVFIAIRCNNILQADNSAAAAF